MTGFDPEILRPLIIELNGDVQAIAAQLAVDSEELRHFMMTAPVLRRAMDEVIARGVDQSVAVLFQGLDDEHYANRLAAAKVFLNSRAAQRRGFHASAELELKVPRQGGALTLTWLPPEDPSTGSGAKAGPLIEGTVQDGGD